MVVNLGVKPFRTSIEFYDSIKNMPVHRHHEFQKVSLRDVGIGSTMADYNAYSSKLHSFLNHNKIAEAKQEEVNRHNAIFYMIEKIGIWSYSFCTFIKSINGKPYEATELDEYRETIMMLSKKGLATDKCESVIEEVKKNLRLNLNYIFLIDTQTQETLML